MDRVQLKDSYGNYNSNSYSYDEVSRSMHICESSKLKNRMHTYK